MAPTLQLIIGTAIAASLLYAFLLRRWRVWSKALPPGPRPWPIVGNLPHLGLKPHQTMAELAKVYGPLMHLKMGFKHVVVAASAGAAEQFLKAHDAKFSSRPPTAGAKYIAYNYQDMVFAPYGPRWRRLRKICALHLFSAKALDDFRHVRQEEVGILVGTLAGAGNTPVTLGQMLSVCATNALARVMLGRRVICHGDEKAEDFKSMVIELMTVAGIFNIGDFIPALEWLDLQGVTARMKKIHKRFDAFLSEILDEHMINGSGEADRHVDMLSTLISLPDVNEGSSKLTHTEIKALLLNLFAAGTDTTTSTVEWAIAELLRHPEILARVQNELDSVVGKYRLVSESDLGQLPFLQAVVKENFRLHPSTPLSLPRIAGEDCEVNGYFVPKGSTLLVNVWAISRDPEQWSDPNEFRPERFLPGGEKPDVDVKGNDFEIIPFGAGRRICAGMSLGIRIVQLLTATLVHAFDFELADGKSGRALDMEEAYGLALQRAEPLVVQPNPRLEAHVYQARADLCTGQPVLQPLGVILNRPIYR